MVHLRQALWRMPDIPQPAFGLATAFEQIGTRDADEEADRLYLRFIEEHPNSPMVEQAEKARTAFAQRRLKASSVGGSRPDVMMYIASALQTFEKLGPQMSKSPIFDSCLAPGIHPTNAEPPSVGGGGVTVHPPMRGPTSIQGFRFHGTAPTMRTPGEQTMQFAAVLPRPHLPALSLREFSHAKPTTTQ